MISPETPETRTSALEAFYKELIPSLVDFVAKMGIIPAHEVLNEPVQYAPFLSSALRDEAVVDEQDRRWLLTQIGYFVGEYFAQKYGGCWFVNDIPDSRYFGRCVVGRFSKLRNAAAMIDPFSVGQVFVTSPPPHELEKLLSEVDRELLAA